MMTTRQTCRLIIVISVSVVALAGLLYVSNNSLYPRGSISMGHGTNEGFITEGNRGNDISGSRAGGTDISGTPKIHLNAESIAAVAGKTAGSGKGASGVAADDKKQLLADILDAVRAEIATLKKLNQSDAVVLARIKNLEQVQTKLQTMYTNLLDGRITDSDVEFTPEEVAEFLPSHATDNSGAIVDTGSAQAIAVLQPALTTLRALRDASIYWKMELGIQNYNPVPQTISMNMGQGSFATSARTDVSTAGGGVVHGIDGSRGGNAMYATGNFTHDDDMDGPPPSLGTRLSQTEGPYAASNSSSLGSTTSQIGPSSSDRTWSPGSGPGSGTDSSSFDYKTRLKQTCDAIKSGQIGDPLDFACLPAGTDVSATFDYKGRYGTVCDRLGYTWGMGYQQMLGCPATSS